MTQSFNVLIRHQGHSAKHEAIQTKSHIHKAACLLDLYQAARSSKMHFLIVIFLPDVLRLCFPTAAAAALQTEADCRLEATDATKQVFIFTSATTHDSEHTEQTNLRCHALCT